MFVGFIDPPSDGRDSEWFVCVFATVRVGGAGANAGGPGVGGDRRLPGQLHGWKFIPLLQWRGSVGRIPLWRWFYKVTEGER